MLNEIIIENEFKSLHDCYKFHTMNITTKEIFYLGDGELGKLLTCTAGTTTYHPILKEGRLRGLTNTITCILAYTSIFTNMYISE